MALLHGRLGVADGIHVPFSFTYANEVSLLAATGFLPTDIGKLALLQDTKALFELTGCSPITWDKLSSGGLYVPTSRTINTKPLTTDIILNAADVGADVAGAAAAITLAGLGGVPTTRTVNGKPLSTNITLNAADVGAEPAGTLAYGGASTGSYYSPQVASSLSVNLANGNYHRIMLASGLQTITVSGQNGGGFYTLKIVQPSFGAAGTVTWPSNFRWANGITPTLTTARRHADLVMLFYDNVGGVFDADLSPNHSN